MDNLTKTTIIIAQAAEAEMDELATKLGEEENYSVVLKTTDGLVVQNFLQESNVDVAIIDLALRNADGYTLIEKIKDISPDTRVIIYSNLTHPSFVSKSVELGASCYLSKPCTIDEVKAAVAQCLAQPSSTLNATANKAIDKRLSNIFITVGIPAHIKGYQFLREAIKLAIEYPDMINSITKKLYPTIAEKFETSSSKVERAIRHAIEVAWNRGKIENINEIFGLKIYSSNDKPTNGEFIALVADKLIIEGA